MLKLDGNTLRKSEWAMRIESVNQFGCAQKVVVAGRIQLDTPHPVGVDEQVVEVKEVVVGKVVGDDALDLVVNAIRFLQVQRAPAFANQLIPPRIRVEGPIRAF